MFFFLLCFILKTNMYLNFIRSTVYMNDILVKLSYTIVNVMIEILQRMVLYWFHAMF